MIRKKGEGYFYLYLICDLLLTTGCWIAAYWLRFDLGWLPIPKGRPPISFYLISLLAIAPIWTFVFNSIGLYSAWRIKSAFQEILAVLKGVFYSIALLSVFSFFYREIEFSRLVIAIFVVLNVMMLIGGRLALRRIIESRRRKGHGMRRTLLVGNGMLAAKLVQRAKENPWAGFDVIGIVDRDAQTSAVTGIPLLGDLSDLVRIAEEQAIDDLVITLPFDRMTELNDVFAQLNAEHLTVRMVPDLLGFGLLMNASVDDLDGLPLINLVDSPMVGVNAFLKRGFDILFSAFFLVIFSPVYLLVALSIKVTSKGPVVYKQERMGLDGELFAMLKFRSMPVDAEKNGPVWGGQSDKRATAIGNVLRRTNLDELPQFINVLRGEMSVVGPRPERPVFIEKFRELIPRYNLRHKIKSGITGWAQINGWRGDTSLEKRIEYDLYYIENWSLGFDLKIIFLTVFRGS